MKSFSIVLFGILSIVKARPTIKMATFCPSKNDLIVARGQTTLQKRGWIIVGNGAAATKTAFNLLGGSIEYTLDLSGVSNNINTNVYSISPHSPLSKSGFLNSDYCDSQSQSPCVEVDYVENNGRIGGASTLHDDFSGGGCGRDGCQVTYRYASTMVHMRIDFALNGTPTITQNGKKISNNDMKQDGKLHVTHNDYNHIKDAYSNTGAVIYSSQWEGWVPTIRDIRISKSRFAVSDLKITGSVQSGPTPTLC